MWDLWMDKRNQIKKVQESDEEDYSENIEDKDLHEKNPATEKSKEAGEEVPLKDEWEDIEKSYLLCMNE